MSAYIEQDSGFFTRRGVVVGVILGLHVFIAWALATGLAHRAIEALAPPIQTVIEQETKQEAPPPPPPPPTFERPPVEIPPTDTVIELPVQQAATTAITNTTTQHVAAPPPKALGAIVAPKTGKNFPNSEDFYPAASKRLNEEGSSVVKVCVGPNDKLTETPVVAQSSGSARLDEGAINLAKAGRYQHGTEDGKPMTACFQFRVTFKMQK
jgi:protein TonB